MSIKWGWDKQTVVQSYNEILHNNKKKNELPKYELTQMNTENIIQIKKSQTQKDIYMVQFI